MATQPTPESANADEKIYRMLTGNVDAVSAIDEVVGKARRNLRVFDNALKDRGFNSPARFATLSDFLRRDRANQLLIALHETDGLELDCPRLLVLLRQFPDSIKINRTVGVAQQANDPFILADQAHFWHKLHYEHPRSILSLNSPADAKPLLDRFDEIWESTEHAVSPSPAGL
jgi:hypothetical protein